MLDRGDTPFQVEGFYGLAVVFQNHGSGLRFLGRDDTAGHGIDHGGRRLHYICGTDNLGQIEPNTPPTARRRDAIEYYLGRRHIASLGGVDYRAYHGLGIPGHQLLGEAGGASPGAGWFARRVTADARARPLSNYYPNILIDKHVICALFGSYPQSYPRWGGAAPS